MVKVVCAIIEKTGKILATQRTENSNQSLKWEFPGGKVKEFESYNEAIIREISEELDIQIYPIHFLDPVQHHYKNFSIELIPIVCNLEIPFEIKLLEHKDYGWFSYKKLKALDFSESDKKLIKENSDYLFNQAGK